MNPFQDQLIELDRRILENEALLSDPELSALATEELSNLKAQRDALLQAADAMQAAKDRNVQSTTQFTNCTIEIRPGAGGDEAKIWATDLMQMYIRYANMRKWKVEELDDLVFKIIGRDAYETLKFESGVHRVQRVPETESQGRVHTSTASVAVLPEVPAAVVEIKEEDLEWKFTRAGGHGGQNVNKVSSAVMLTHRPSGIVVESRRERYQARNRELALELLRAQLWEIEEEKRQKETGKFRLAIGRNMRAEKIRTYNYPQNRVTDHRVHHSWYALETIVTKGDMDIVTSYLADPANWEKEGDAESMDEE